MLAALIAGAAIPSFLDLVVRYGHNIPLSNGVPRAQLARDYVTAVTAALILALSILVLPVPMRQKIDLLFVWLLRCGVTLGFMLYVENHYQAMDAYSYFAGPQALSYQSKGFVLGAGTQNIEHLVWIAFKYIPHSFHLLMVLWSFIGLIATYLFYLAARLVMRRDDRRIFFALTLFPSIVYWSSLLGKDPVNLLGTALYALGVVGLYRTRRPFYVLAVVAGITIAIYIRSWYGPIMVLPLVGFALGRSGQQKHLLPKLLLLVLISIAALYLWNQTRFAESIQSTNDFVATSNELGTSYSTGGSAVSATHFSSLSSLIVQLPYGMVTALYRPLPGEVRNIFGLLASLENVVLVFLTIIAVKRATREDLKEPLVLWAGLFVLVWAAAYGIAAYANLGTVVRYKLQVVPIFLGLLLYLGRPHNHRATETADEQPTDSLPPRLLPAAFAEDARW